MSENTAYHEAGHAFAAVYVGARVVSATITPDRDDGPDRFGDTRVEWPLGDFPRQELLESMVHVALAGPVAEATYRGEPFHPGLVGEWAHDWQAAWESAQELVREERARLRFLEQSAARMYRLLSDELNWAAVAAIADSLLAHEYIEGDEVREIVTTWLG